MDNDSILARTETLRREIEVIQHQENNYRHRKYPSFADMVERQRREFRILELREELKTLRDKGLESMHNSRRVA